MLRDFTYVDDVEGIVRLISHPPVGQEVSDEAPPNSSTSAAPWRIFRIGNNKPEELMKVAVVRKRN